MSDIGDDEIEELAEPIPHPSATPDLLNQKRTFLRQARRELNEKQLASPVVSTFLLEDVERLERENEDLKRYRDEFHRVDKANALLERRRTEAKVMEFRDAAMLAIGAAGLGAAPSYIPISNIGWVFFGLFLLLTLTAVFLRSRG